MGRHPEAFFKGQNKVWIRFDDDNAEMVRRFMRENGYLSVTGAVNDLLRDFCLPCLERCKREVVR